MSESQNRQPTTTADSAVFSAVLLESDRQQYLSAMGIQTWYDPVLSSVEAKTEAPVIESQPPVDCVKKPVDGAAPESLSESSSKSNSADAPAESAAQKTVNNQFANNLAELSVRVDQCQLCELHATRRQTVFGEGSAEAALMIITDAPVADALFAAESKLMLQQMLQAINIDLSEVYLTSLVKCPTPEQRAPHTTEMICCDDHLSAQIKLIQPKVILVSGERASQQLLVSQKSLADLRLRQYQHQGVPVYASCHAQELPGSAVNKRKAWQDLLQIKKMMST